MRKALCAAVLLLCLQAGHAALTGTEDYAARAWTPAGERGAAYTLVVRVANSGETPLALRVTTAGAPDFQVSVDAPPTLGAQGEARVIVRASLSATEAQKLPPFTPEPLILTVTGTPVGGAAETVTVPLLVSTAGPLTPPGAAHVGAVRARAAGPEWSKAAAGQRNRGDQTLKALGETFEPPLEAGWLEGAPERLHHTWHWPKYVDLVKLPDGNWRCPECGQIWTPQQLREGHDRFFLYRSSLEPLGHAALLTGDARYAQALCNVLSAMAQVYLSYPVGPYRTRLGLNFMHECSFDLPALNALRQVQAAGMISPDTLRQIANGFLVPSMETLLTTSLGTPNQQALRASTVGTAGLVLNWPPYVAWALRDPDKGFFALVREYVGRDGGWLEGSLSYHELAELWITPLPAVLDLYGYNVLGEEEVGARLRNFFIFPLLAGRPDGRLPAINDAGLASLTNPVNNQAFRLTRDPRLLKYKWPLDLEYAVDDPPPAETVPWASRDFPDFGICVMHDHGAPGQENWVLLDYGEHGGGHGHFDKLNVVPYAYGQPLEDDLGSNYGASLQQFSWYRNTLSHNTMTVDENGQKATTGKLDFWSAPDQGPQIAVASTEGAYPGVRLERAVVLAAGVQIYLDHAVSDTAHTYDWTFSLWGPVGQTSFPAQDRGPLPAKRLSEAQMLDMSTWMDPPGPGIGYDMPTNLREGTVAGDWWMDWPEIKAPYSKDQPVSVRWLGWCPAPMRVVWGEGLGMSQPKPAPCWLMARQQGKSAAWVTALVAYRGQQPACSLQVVQPAQGQGLGVHVTRGDRSAWIAVNWAPGQRLQVGPLTTTERAAARE